MIIGVHRWTKLLLAYGNTQSMKINRSLYISPLPISLPDRIDLGGLGLRSEKETTMQIFTKNTLVTCGRSCNIPACGLMLSPALPRILDPASCKIIGPLEDFSSC